MRKMSPEGKAAAWIAASVIGVSAGASCGQLKEAHSEADKQQRTAQSNKRADRIVKAAGKSVLKTSIRGGYADLMCMPGYCQERVSEGFTSDRIYVAKDKNGERSSILSGSVTVNIEGAKDPAKTYALWVTYQECPPKVRLLDCMDYKIEEGKSILIRDNNYTFPEEGRKPDWEITYNNGHAPESSMGITLDNSNTQQVDQVLEVVEQLTNTPKINQQY